MRILVIDDRAENQQSARETLGNHDLVVATSVREAYEILYATYGRYRRGLGGGAPFDAVLTDLWVPAVPAPNEKEEREPFYIQRFQFNWGQQGLDEEALQHPDGVGFIPAGLVFALAALGHAVPVVAIVSDGNHHTGQVNALLDLIEWPPQPDRELLKVYAFDSRDFRREDGSKDWGAVLEQLNGL